MENMLNTCSNYVLGIYFYYDFCIATDSKKEENIMLSRLDTALKLTIFFVIAAILFVILGNFVELFKVFFIIAAVLAAISFLAWIFKKMFLNNNQQ